MVLAALIVAALALVVGIWNAYAGQELCRAGQFWSCGGRCPAFA
jgi:hypothetical protein